MRAFRYHAFGESFSPRVEDLPEPVPREGEALVRIRSASLNPVDWKIATGHFRALVRGGLPRTMGSDFAGEIAALGPGSTTGNFAPGDRVWGFVDPFRQAQGTFADFCCVPQSHLFPLPASIGFEDAAALACVGATSVRLCNLAGVGPGSRVLVNGASGGVGHVAVQVAKARGAKVTAVASAERRSFVDSLGADAFIDYRTTPVDRWPGGFDAVFDCVPSLPRGVHARLLRRGGHYATTLPDAFTFLLDPLTSLLGRVRRHGVMLAPDPAAARELTEAVQAGRLRCHVEAAYPLERAAEAIERSRSGRVQGKLVIRVD